MAMRNGLRAGQWLILQPQPQSWEAHFQGYQVCRWARLGLPDYLSVLPDVLYFDNTYSLLYTKKISYTVEVLLPDKTFEEKIQSLDATGPSSTQ